MRAPKNSEVLQEGHEVRRLLKALLFKKLFLELRKETGLYWTLTSHG